MPVLEVQMLNEAIRPPNTFTARLRQRRPYETSNYVSGMFEVFHALASRSYKQESGPTKHRDRMKHVNN